MRWDVIIPLAVFLAGAALAFAWCNRIVAKGWPRRAERDRPWTGWWGSNFGGGLAGCIIAIGVLFFVAYVLSCFDGGVCQ